MGAAGRYAAAVRHLLPLCLPPFLPEYTLNATCASHLAHHCSSVFVSTESCADLFASNIKTKLPPSCWFHLPHPRCHLSPALCKQLAPQVNCSALYLTNVHYPIAEAVTSCCTTLSSHMMTLHYLVFCRHIPWTAATPRSHTSCSFYPPPPPPSLSSFSHPPTPLAISAPFSPFFPALTCKMHACNVPIITVCAATSPRPARRCRPLCGL